jgi:hypothetical protein
MVWAVKDSLPVWIPQAWLSDIWRELTGARVVFIRRVSNGGGNVKRIARYCVQQYLAGQSAIVRVSWSWWRSGIKLSGSFRGFYRECRKGFYESRITGASPFGNHVGDLSYKDVMKGWTKLLETGSWRFGNGWFFISGDEIDYAYL